MVRQSLEESLGKLSDYDLQRALTGRIRRQHSELSYRDTYLWALVNEVRARLVREVQGHRYRQLRPVRRCCSRSARCRGLFVDIRRWLQVLDGPGFPEDGLTSHFGESFQHGRIGVNIANYGAWLFVGLYPRHYGGAISDTLKNQWLRAAAKQIAPIVNEWNGSNGSSRGLSIVLRRPCPKSLQTAISNYRSLKDVFAYTPEIKERYKKFDDWLKSRLGKL